MPVTEAHLEDFRHRVANDLMLLVGVLARQRKQASALTVDEALDAAVSAVLSLAQFYRQLFALRPSDKFIDLSSHLEGIHAGLRAAYLDKLGVTVRFEADPVHVPSTVARDIGLIVTELVANAAKHAFSQKAGQVSVRLSDGEEGLVCRVTDDGCGLAGDFRRDKARGLVGSTQLAEALGGRLEAMNRVAGGASFALIIPHGQDS